MNATRRARTARPVAENAVEHTTPGDPIDAATKRFSAAAIAAGLVRTDDERTHWQHLDRLVRVLQLDPETLTAADWDALTVRLTGTVAA